MRRSAGEVAAVDRELGAGTPPADSSPNAPSAPESPSGRGSKVQHANAALELAARGLGETVVTRALLDSLGYADRLAGVPLDPPLHEAFAFIRRRNARPSPATRALMTLAEHHLSKLSDQPT